MPRAYSPKMSTVTRAQRVMRVLHPDVQWHLYRDRAGHTALHWRTPRKDSLVGTLTTARLRDLEAEVADLNDGPALKPEVVCPCGTPFIEHSPLLHWVES